MDDKIYFIRDNEQQIPVYDFIKAMDPDAPIRNYILSTPNQN
jgi:hypothetical protein